MRQSNHRICLSEKSPQTVNCGMRDIRRFLKKNREGEGFSLENG